MLKDVSNKYSPGNSELAEHVDHSWVVDVNNLFHSELKVRAYPGLTPEIIIPFRGYYTMDYLGKKERIDAPMVYAYIYDGVVIDFSGLESSFGINWRFVNYFTHWVFTSSFFCRNRVQLLTTRF